MGTVAYDVPLVTQSQNPICWVACMAMVASERQGFSVGVGKYAAGFDPNSSCISNPSANIDDFYVRMDRCGFNSVAVDPTPAVVENVLKTCGPFILTHDCAGFPYGSGWAAMTSGRHAVVITAYDSDTNGGTCFMNNPWGDKDRAIQMSAIIAALTKAQAANVKPVGYFRDKLS